MGRPLKQEKRPQFRLRIHNWLVLSDEQMRKGWPFFLLNDEQMSNWLGVEHLPDNKLPRLDTSN